MSIAISTPSAQGTARWCEMMRDRLPEWEVHPASDVPDPDAVEYCVVWKPPTGMLAGFRNLKAIVSIGAGIDHVLADAELPRHLPIIRTIGTDLTQRMKEYVALHVLRHHRELPQMQANQTQAEWKAIIVPPATKRRVGVMGLGNLGAEAARLLAQIGFDVAGWSRGPKGLAGVRCFHGTDGLAAFLEGVEILVCLLPLTDGTRDILNARTFAGLAKGASVINAARGEHLVEADLLAALSDGTLSGATLDVFRTEPLPKDHPFWSHPQITVTPHVASLIDAPTGSAIIARNILTFHRTGTVDDLADAVRGY